MKFTELTGERRAEWTAAEFTQAQALILRGDLRKALSALLDACARSSDHTVARAYEQYDAVKGAIKLLGGSDE